MECAWCNEDERDGDHGACRVALLGRAEALRYKADRLEESAERLARLVPA